MAEIEQGMNELLDKIQTKAEKAKEIAQQVIDSEAKAFADSVRNGIPETDVNIADKGGLKNAFTFEKYTGNGANWYGYKLEFKGTTKYGDSWEKVANIINYGRVNYNGTMFVTKAKKKLKGMTDRINARIEAELNKNGD